MTIVVLSAALIIAVLQLGGHDVFAGGYRFYNKFRRWNGKMLYAESGYSFTNLDSTLFLYRSPLPDEPAHDAVVLEIADPTFSAKVSPKQVLEYLRADTNCPAGKTCETRFVPRKTERNFWQCRQAQWIKQGTVVTSGMCFAPYLRWRATYRYGDRVKTDSAAVVHTLEKMLP